MHKLRIGNCLRLTLNESDTSDGPLEDNIFSLLARRRKQPVIMPEYSKGNKKGSVEVVLFYKL